MVTRYFQIFLLVFLLLQDILKVTGQGNPECDFTSNFCEWTNTGWKIEEYISTKQYTGPLELYDGAYIAMDAGIQSEATISSRDILTTKWPCFIFRYHMKGPNTIGNLTIRIANQRDHISGHQGDSWKCGRIYLPDYGTTVKLDIVAYKKEGEDVAIIALDTFHFFLTNREQCSTDLSLTTEECDNINGEIITTEGSTSSTSATTTASAIEDESLWPDWQTYAIAIPGGVLVLSIILVIIGVCVKRRKHDDGLYNKSLQNLENNPRIQYSRPSEASSERYPDVFGNAHHEVYDTINDKDVYDYIDGGDVNRGHDDYLQPVGNFPEGKDEGYTILPAITKPQAPYDGDYLHPKQMNIPHKPGKKISISDQGEVCYTDVRETIQRNNAPLRFSGYTDYLDVSP